MVQTTGEVPTLRHSRYDANTKECLTIMPHVQRTNEYKRGGRRVKECKGLDELGRCRLIVLMVINSVAQGQNWKCRKEGCAFYDQLTKKEEEE